MSHLATVTAALPVRDVDVVARCRQEASHRPLHYPYGSAQAEELALVGGLRPLIRQRLQAKDLAAVQAIAARHHLHVALAPQLYGEGKGGQDQLLDASAGGSEAAYRTIVIGRDPQMAARAIACEHNDDFELGRLLGYPRCCVEAFVAQRAPRRNLALLASSAARTAGRFEPRLNVADLAIFHFVSWTPCSFSCELSLKYANRVAALVERRHPGFRVQIDDALGAHRLVLSDDAQLSMRGTFDGGEVRIEHAWPTACDRHPGAALDDDAREAVGRLLALVRGARRLSVRGTSLRLDDEVFELPMAPLLLPFGQQAV